MADKVNTYAVKYWPGLASDYKCPEAAKPIIYSTFNSEKKAKEATKEFPFMSYEKHLAE